MRLLDRYLLRELLVPLFFCLSFLIVFVVAFSLFSELNQYQENKLNLGDVLQLYMIRIPGDLVLVMPIALLLALLYGLTNHARHNELTAMRAAGVSLARLCVPYLAVAVLLGAGVFYMSENWVPQAADREYRIMHRRTLWASGAPNEDEKAGLIFDNVRDQRFWHIDHYNLKTFAGLNPKVDWRLHDGTRRQLVADRVEYTNDVWTFFSNVHEYELAPTPGARVDPIVVTNVLAMPEFAETPDQIGSEDTFNSFFKNLTTQFPDIPIRAILDYLDLHPKMPEKEHRRLLTELHSRMAAPLTCVVVVLVSIPFGAASGRRNLFVGVASAIFLVLAYFVLMKLGTGLGTAGILPPWVAAWLPNICFTILGLILIDRVR